MAEAFSISSVTQGSEEDLDVILSTYKQTMKGYKDISKNSLLHLCLQNDRALFVRKILQHEKHYSTPEQISEWLNEINQDGYTVLHLSVSKGILSVVKSLINHGASTEIKTPMGLGVVHLAAQGDFPQLIAFFGEIGLELEGTDSRGLTPLHWASYMGAYHSALVLCSCRVSRNQVDVEGHTPLHLAVVGNNLRVVKLLIIKGSLKDAKDNSGKTAKDHAIANRFTQIADTLKNNTIMEIMGFKPNITPFATSLWPFVILTVSLICTFLLIGIFCATYNRIFSYIFAISSTIVICLIVYIINSDPGFLPKNSDLKLTELYDNNKPSEICPDCKIVKAKRSRHCHQCHRCVKKFDHHCQWLNNCIGAKNLGFFYAFILALWINIIVGIMLCISTFISSKRDSDGDDISLTASQILAGFCVVIELVLLLPVCYLLLTHTKNFILGLTTNERLSAAGKNYEGSNNCCGNCADMCCNVGDRGDELARFQSTSTVTNLEVSMQETR